MMKTYVCDEEGIPELVQSITRRGAHSRFGEGSDTDYGSDAPSDGQCDNTGFKGTCDVGRIRRQEGVKPGNPKNDVVWDLL